MMGANAGDSETMDWAFSGGSGVLNGSLLLALSCHLKLIKSSRKPSLYVSLGLLTLEAPIHLSV